MAAAARVAIDRSGRLVLPKAIRDEAGIEPGMPLSISVRDGHVEIEPAYAEVRIVKRDGVAVAEYVYPPGKLAEAEVRKIRDEMRERRKKWW